MESDRDIKVIIVDDHQVFRKSLRLILQEIPGLDVTEEAGDGRVAIEKVDGHCSSGSCPHVIIMDINMPVLDGIEATRQIKRLRPEITIIALSSYSDGYFIQKMIDAGASDFLTKSAGIHEIESAIHRACSHGKCPLST